MNPPPPVELTARLLHDAKPLRRYLHELAQGYAIEISDIAEPVYLLGTPDGREIAVPVRTCGEWNPALMSGRHFFFPIEPDHALSMVSVRKVDHYIGRLTYPSSWQASPWLSAANRRSLYSRLRDMLEELLHDRLDASTPALQRATPHPAAAVTTSAVG